MQLSSRILTALAVLILSVAVVAVRGGGGGIETVEAATGTIDVLNVGTCYTTDTDVFSVSDCDDGDVDDNDDDSENNSGYSVAGRDEITQVDPNKLYATYAIDPKTSGDEPRAILKHSDLIKISIEDKGRDKRRGVLYAVGATPPATELTSEIASQVVAALKDKLASGLEKRDMQGTPEDNTDDHIGLESLAAVFVGPSAGIIADSGDAEFRLDGADSTDNPMAPEGDGEVRWLGYEVNDGATGPLADQEIEDLTDRFIELDEDLSSGDAGSVAPWMRVTASIPEGRDVIVSHIYYETSTEEDLIGAASSSDERYDAEDPDTPNAPVFEDSDKDLLVVRASSDGDAPNQNLWLRETSLFSGRYEGYLRLTDADGDGKCDHDGDANADEPTEERRCNWGLPPDAASGPGMMEYAVLGVESGPVKITYKDSTGDNETVTILIDHTPPTIQVDSPVNGTSSKDDSPELLGSFTDGGGSGLREDSFKVYADNTDDRSDEDPVWYLNVLTGNNDRGKVCADVDDAAAFDCPTSGNNPTLALRSQYAGFSDDDTTAGKGMPTFGIIANSEVYLDPEEEDDDGVELRKTGDAEDFDDGDATGLFDTVIRIDFESSTSGNRYNNTVDIQAVVMDVAGNIGFSDADPSDPTFIHDLGTKPADRDDDDKHNVLGWYSRHVYYLDDVDPYFEEDQSASGFFVDADGDEARSKSGVMIVFDNDLDASTVGVGTFEVELDDGTEATVTDVAVDGHKVYLKLEEELAPNATPGIELASGQAISDLAGNETTSRRLDGIELSDGILPTFTITLSGGSGLNEDVDGESSSELTNASGINISIASDETIQGAPKFAVVCNNLSWDDSEDNDVAKFASNRMGSFTSAKIGEAAPSDEHKDSTADDSTMCGDSYFEVAETSALARPGNRWEYQWANLTGDQKLADGTLSVIVWGRDRSSYEKGDDTVYNYSSSTTSFEYDTDLKAAWEDVKGNELIPDKGDDVFEPRPFVLLDFGGEDTTVDVTKFEVDDVDYTADLEILEDNEFVWWPEPLALGTYTVYVEANDAANNKSEDSYKFSVKPRSPFTLDLLAGWNSISFPANPVDRALHAVFTDPAIDQVIGWNVTEPVSPWRMATRMDGVWTTSDEYATLNDVEARYGYWVHSTGFVKQSVHLAGKTDRGYGGQPSPADIPTDPGWNFVGVIDMDGDQTQDNAGETLRNSNQDPITAGEYLRDYVQAYTWDHVNNTWDVLKENEGIVIGTGIWVFYGSGIAP